MFEVAPLGIFVSEAGVVIASVSASLSIISSLVRLAVLDRDKMREMKLQMKEKQKAVKDATKKKQMKKAQKAQEEMMALTMENMKQTMKPMIFTIIPFILVFGWLKDNYEAVGTVETLFGFDLSWFWWYLIAAIFISIILNKLFRLT